MGSRLRADIEESDPEFRTSDNLPAIKIQIKASKHKDTQQSLKDKLKQKVLQYWNNDGCWLRRGSLQSKVI